MPLCPPKIPHWLTWDRTRVSALGGQRLTAWATARAEWLIRMRMDSVRLRMKCDGTNAEARFRLSPKLTSPFKSAGASVQSTTGSRGVRISGSNAGYAMFRGSVKSTGYPLHSPVSPPLPLPCVTVCHHISTGLYQPTVDTGTDRVRYWHKYYCWKTNQYTVTLNMDIDSHSYLVNS